MKALTRKFGHEVNSPETESQSGIWFNYSSKKAHGRALRVRSVSSGSLGQICGQNLTLSLATVISSETTETFQ